MGCVFFFFCVFFSRLQLAFGLFFLKIEILVAFFAVPEVCMVLYARVCVYLCELL